MTESDYRCPSCGAPLSIKFRYSKLINCQHCNSDVILEDEALKLRGKSSVMAEYPSLLQLGLPFVHKKAEYYPVGRVRYQYSHGYWDEWWVLDNKGEGAWLSVDEGDMALEQAIELKQPILFPELKLGQHIEIDGTHWLITEHDTAECIGLEGELPELIQVGEQMSYAHLSASKNRLLTLEMTTRGLLAYEGQWLDPFEISMEQGAQT